MRLSCEQMRSPCSAFQLHTWISSYSRSTYQPNLLNECVPSQLVPTTLSESSGLSQTWKHPFFVEYASQQPLGWQYQHGLVQEPKTPSVHSFDSISREYPNQFSSAAREADHTNLDSDCKRMADMQDSCDIRWGKNQRDAGLRRYLGGFEQSCGFPPSIKRSFYFIGLICALQQ